MKSKEIIILEDKINEVLKADGKNIHYDYFANGIDAYTSNIKTGENFFMTRVDNEDEEGCLKEILNYLLNHKENMTSYTVNWYKKENGNLGSYNTSYFYCKDMMEVLNKFYTGKDKTNYVIDMIKSNPIA